MKYKITLPEGNSLTGLYLSLRFVNGVAETDSDFVADKARNKGFTVESKKPKANTSTEGETPVGFKCPHCTVTCKTEENLQKHIEKVHKDKLDPPPTDATSGNDGADGNA